MMKNKKLFYGTLIIVILGIVVGVSLFMLKKSVTTPTIFEKEGKEAILSELERLNIEIIGQPKQIELQLPSTLSGPNWGLKKMICEEGGYDLSAYAGKILLFTSCSINEIYDNKELLSVSVLSSGDKIACVFKTVREGSGLIPGIFSVKDKLNIKKK